MIKFVNAKINLGLNIVEKRVDGYHNLETVFLPVGGSSGCDDASGSLCDVLEITDTDSDSDEYVFTGNKIDCPIEKNLVVKAVNLFRKEADTRGIECSPKKVLLEKLLPDGAGMGGGSADASFTLLILNELCGNKFSKDELAALALKLGADCPFFIYNKPMYATGIGEVFSSIELQLGDLFVAIVKPAVSISTREAFANITPCRPKMSVREIIGLPICEWKHLLKNDFEQSMFLLHPEIKSIKDKLYVSGAVYASMTGSGSAFYGFFESRTDAENAVSAMDVPYKTVVSIG